tara:strand:+ start:34518 stop:35453 length:936 start_codon:yes stop_codon:yes gene_type:complete
MIFCFTLFYLNPVVAQIQNDNIKGVLPNQIYDTRSLSMANTTIADVYSTPTIGINTALFGLFIDPSFIQFNTNHNWDNNLMQQDLTLPSLSHGLHHVTGRFVYLHKGFDNLPFTSSPSLSHPDILMYRGEIAYAIAFNNNLSLGALQSLSYTTTNENEEAKYWNYFADIGLVYAPDGPVSYGLVFRGLGNETTYEIIETNQTTLGSRLATQVLELGATLRYPIEERMYLSISFANEKRFGQEGLWYKGGIEIAPFSFIAIRSGAMVNFEQSLFIPRVGLGINAGILQIDYGIAPKNLTGEQFHQVGITLQF